MQVLTEEQLADLVETVFAPTNERAIAVIRDNPMWTEYVHSVIESWGYRRVHFKYNSVTFNSALEMVMECDVALNPFLIVPNIIPPVPPFKKNIYYVLKRLPNTGCDEELTPEEQDICNRLPNGWKSVDGEAFGIKFPQIERQFYRPSLGMTLPGHIMLAGYSLLHPSKPRPLNNGEITAICSHTFFDWVEQITNSFEIGEPNTEPLSFDFTNEQFIPRGYISIAQNTFNWKKL